MTVDWNELRDFLAAVSQTSITELTLKHNDLELTFRKGSGSEWVALPPSVAQTPAAPLPLPQVTPVAVPEPTSPARDRSKWVEITSPMVGTFYRAPAPGEAPFVENGDRIRKGQTVCIIEAMKLMNEIEAEVSGQVIEVAAENGEPVEYGQTLMWVEPD